MMQVGKWAMFRLNKNTRCMHVGKNFNKAKVQGKTMFIAAQQWSVWQFGYTLIEKKISWRWKIDICCWVDKIKSILIKNS